jgi:hypothetical protein
VKSLVSKEISGDGEEKGLSEKTKIKATKALIEEGLAGDIIFIRQWGH